MQQRPGEITIRHLQSIIQPPQRRGIRITDPGEPPAARRVRLEHQQRLPRALRDPARVEEGRDQRRARRVVQVVREDVLREFGGADAVFGEAVVVGVAGGGGKGEGLHQ
jgi:hypothetical protein